MTKVRRSVINTTPSRHADDLPTLSKGQRTFNALARQIENRHKRLADWEVAITQFQHRYAGEFLPLERSRIALQVRFMHSLDQVYEYDAFTRAGRRKISAPIINLAHDLIDEGASLEALYNKYSGTDFDWETAMQATQMKARLKATLGIGLGDGAGVHSGEVLLQRVREHFAQRAEKKAAAATKHEARRATRKKSPKQLAAETQEADKQAQVSLSIREVYCKLASALHPDRETDPQEREHKTRLMQRVNEAYDRNNLLQLLELQLELEHIDQHLIDRTSEARLTHYNQVLKDQARELDRQIYRIETTFRHMYGCQQFEALSPDAVLQELGLSIATLRQQVYNTGQDLAASNDFRDVRCMLEPRTMLD